MIGLALVQLKLHSLNYIGTQKNFGGSKCYEMRTKLKLSFLLIFLHVFMTTALEYSYQSMYDSVRSKFAHPTLKIIT